MLCAGAAAAAPAFAPLLLAIELGVARMPEQALQYLRAVAIEDQIVPEILVGEGMAQHRRRHRRVEPEKFAERRLRLGQARRFAQRLERYRHAFSSPIDSALGVMPAGQRVLSLMKSSAAGLAERTGTASRHPPGGSGAGGMSTSSRSSSPFE